MVASPNRYSTENSRWVPLSHTSILLRVFFSDILWAAVLKVSDRAFKLKFSFLKNSLTTNEEISYFELERKKKKKKRKNDQNECVKKISKRRERFDQSWI